jgi:hypothetical protein
VNSTVGADFMATVLVIIGEIIQAIADAIITASQNATQMMALSNGIFGN